MRAGAMGIMALSLKMHAATGEWPTISMVADELGVARMYVRKCAHYLAIAGLVVWNHHAPGCRIRVLS